MSTVQKNDQTQQMRKPEEVEQERKDTENMRFEPVQREEKPQFTDWASI